MPGRERAKYLYRIARVIQERAREFAVLESLDNGKPIKESRDVDIPLAAAHFFYHAGWADKLGYAGFGPDPRPIGVAGQVIPWNFPLLMAAWKLAPALATGNTCVLKPAETTPLSALLLAEVIAEADLPPGTVNIVTGDGRTGRDLVAHPGVDKIAFTGSTEVGKEIQRAIAGTGKRLTLELGGKAANIVFDDAPIDQAVEGIVNGIFFNQGHVCCAGSRLLAQESIADTLLDRLKARLETLRLGDPLDKNTDIGAINSREQLDKITSLVAAGEAEGGQRWSPACPLPARGYWFPPTVFSGVSQSHRIAREEIFGPVLSVLTFRTPEEAVAKANNTPVRAVRRGLDGERKPDPVHGTTVARGRGLGQHLQQVRPGQPVRRVPGIRVRAGGRPDRAWPRTSMAERRAPGEGARPGARTRAAQAGGKARKAKASGGTADGASGRARPRASQPAVLAGASPVPDTVATSDGGASRETRSRLDVRKTYKLFIGGAFPRSESGRSYPVAAPGGTLLAHAARASRKDARDAVVAARKAGPGWAGATAYNRGQVLYRVAELLQGRAAQFAEEIVKNEGLSGPKAARTVAEAIDRWVWYAGWPDKVAQVAGAANPVAGPYFNFSVPEPTGVVAVLAPPESGLLGLVSVLAPVIATGNTAVVVASEPAPLPAVTLSEVLATSDVPGGVVNILTGRLGELAPVLAAHMDVNAIDLTGAPADTRAELERLAAGNVKRVFAAGEDWAAPPSPARMLAFLEIKTVWHPVGV